MFEIGDVVLMQIGTSLYREVVISREEYEDFYEEVTPNEEILFTRIIAVKDLDTGDAWSVYSQDLMEHDTYTKSQITKYELRLDEDYAKSKKVSDEVKEWLE